MSIDLFQIIRTGNLEAYSNHIGNFDINMVNEHGQSLLHEAIAFRQEEIALDLLQRSIVPDIKDKNGQTPLHLIPFHPNVVVAERIISRGGELGAIDIYGNTPLWYAVFNARGKYELVELFLSRGGQQSISVKNKAGRTPLDFATQIGDHKLVSMLNQYK